MPLSEDDVATLGHLADAAKLYERYLELSRVADVGTPLDDDNQLPPPIGLPLTLTIRRAH